MMEAVLLVGGMTEHKASKGVFLIGEDQQLCMENKKKSMQLPVALFHTCLVHHRNIVYLVGGYHFPHNSIRNSFMNVFGHFKILNVPTIRIR